MQTIERTSAELAEIERHKYYLSEKAGHDVGWELAEEDWEKHHAAAFRAEIHPAVKRGGLKMLFHRMFSKAEKSES